MDRLAPPLGDSSMPNVLAVVGEHRDDPSRLLVLGGDGLHYDLNLSDGLAIPIDPGEEWVIDSDMTAGLELLE